MPGSDTETMTSTMPMPSSREEATPSAGHDSDATEERPIDAIATRLHRKRTKTKLFQIEWEDSETEGVDDSDADASYDPDADRIGKTKEEKTLVFSSFKTKGICVSKPKKRRVHGQQCNKCSDTFQDMESLAQHEEEKHPQGLTCSHCDQVFYAKSTLYSHVQHVHTPHKHKCPFENCDKTYPFRSELNLHVSVHKESLNYMCPSTTCKSVCSTQKALAAHMKRSHSQVQNYQCEECSYTMMNQASLLNHVRGTHGDGWQCESCGMLFKVQSTFFRHKQKCSGPRDQYRCSFPVLP